MKKILYGLILTGALSVLLFACKKEENKAWLTNGTFFTAASNPLTSSVSTIVLDSSSGGTKKGITFTWPAVNYTSPVVVTYTLQIDSIKGTFAKPVTVNMANATSKSYTMGDFNTLAQSLGLVPGTAGQLQMRLKADVIQTNGNTSAVPTTISNVINVTITPYSTIPKPIYPVPAALFLVGDATTGGWNNPVPVPTQQFTQIDPNTFGIVTQLTGGKQFLILPVNGDWSHKYAITGAGDPAGGAFVPDAANNMVGPTTTGLYKIIVDFVKGTYTITPSNGLEVPPNLYIVGDATAGGWNNPVPTPSQQFTQLTSGEFSITINLTSGASYLFLPLNGDWGHKYGGNSATGGALLSDGAVPGSNTPAPSTTGSYKVYVNFFTKQYTVK
jgi:hypothetical protein